MDYLLALPGAIAIGLSFGLPGMAGTYLGAVIAAFVPGVMQLARRFPQNKLKR